jgi:hypothetical protein
LQGDKKKALAHTIIYIYIYIFFFFFVNFLPHQYVSFSIQILINVHENKEETQGQIVLKLCDFFQEQCSFYVCIFQIVQKFERVSFQILIAIFGCPIKLLIWKLLFLKPHVVFKFFELKTKS